MSRRLLDKLPKMMEDPEFAEEWDKSKEEISAVKKKCGIKLNIFQRGILQKCATAFVYFVSIGVGAFILDWLDKQLFIRLAEEARQRDILSPDALRGFTALIEARESTTIFVIILIGVGCGFVGWLFMRWAAKRNWSWPITLPRVVSFRTAMRRLGIIDPKDEIAFVKKYKLPVFIASIPLIEDEYENISVKLYAFAHHSEFSAEDVFEQNIGRQTLCLNFEDYNSLMSAGKQRTSLEESVAVAEKDAEIKSLRLSVASLTEENVTLAAERDALRGKTQMQPAHEEGRVDRLRVESLHWAAFIPAMDRLLREVPQGKKYTTPEIEAAYAAEWANRPELRAKMQRLTGSEEGKPSESLISAVKADFKESGLLSTGGRPRKNP